MNVQDIYAASGSSDEAAESVPLEKVVARFSEVSEELSRRIKEIALLKSDKPKDGAGN